MRLILGLFVSLWAGAALATAPSCGPTETHHAVSLNGEAAGARSLFLQATEDWTFVLQRQPLGWQIQLKDSGGRDLSRMTPPRQGPNPRDLMGWHFRNSDNSGPNTGAVNAPQNLRLFQFNVRETGDGRGWLYLRDYGLADLAPGQQARMVYAAFSACLTWPKTPEEKATEADAVSPYFVQEEQEIFGRCGLRPPYRLEAWMMPRMLGGNFDGDEALDDFGLIIRTPDGRRGIALCRAGTWLSLLGFDAPISGLPDSYLQQVEAWRMEESDTHSQLILERPEKSAYALTWEDEGLKARLLYGGVETGEPE